MRKPAAVLFVLSLAVLALALVPAAGLAAKGGNAAAGGGGKPGGGGGGAGTSSLDLVVLYSPSGDGLAHYNGQVTFTVSTTATAKPSVNLTCSKNGAMVYGHTAGFYPEYPWPEARTYTLKSSVWTGGAAACVAELYYVDSRGRSTTLKTLSFQALA